MQFAFTEEQQQLRNAVRDLLAKECPPSAVRAAWDNETGRVPGLWRHLAEAGVIGLTTPAEHGGLGLNELDLLLIMEEVGRAAVPDPLTETMAVVAPMLVDLGRKELLTATAAGDVSFAVGLEQFPFVLAADTANCLILQKGETLHLVQRASVGLKREESVDGSRRLFRVQWEPSTATRFATGEKAVTAVGNALDRGALATSAQLIGLARHLIDVTVEYIKVREQFQKPVGSFQAVKHHLANALVKLEFARPLVYRAAWSMAHKETDRSVHVSMAKSQASDAAMLASRAALQCHGAIGYTYEYDLQLWMKRAWTLAGAWGDAVWHRARVGTAILDRPTGEV
jgi:alkylation response protein AidB-like acyl-CoA dehydrogenase